MTGTNAIDELRDLLVRLEQTRTRLETLEDSSQAVDLLQDLAELAKQTQVAIEHARRQGPGEPARDAPG